MKISSLFLLLPTLFLICFLSNDLFAQGVSGRGGDRPAIGIIKGKLIDEATGNPIEYGSLAVLSARDSSLAGGTISDPRGEFRIDQVKTGKYIIRIQFMGYETKYINNVMIRPDSPEVYIGTINMQNRASDLAGVEITGEKQMLVSNLDKKIINVDKSIASIGGSAVEVMENIPSVTVDAEGNVSLRGSSNVTILVDGKPSGLAEMSSSDLLQQIPASSIESIEVITNPSVRYDPEGTSGIINIVLKKKSLQGLNGMVSVTAGTGDRYNGSLNLNYRKDRVNFFAGYDNRLGRFKSTGETERISTYEGISSTLLQSQEMTNKRNMHSVNTGFDFLINNFNTLTLSFQYRSMNFGNKGNVNSRTFNANDSLTRAFDRYSDSDREIASYNYNLSYKKTFATKGKEFTTDFMFTDNAMSGNQQIEQTEASGSLEVIPLLQFSGSDNTNNMYMLQSNFITPVWETGRIETGIKATVKDLGMKNYLEDFDRESNEWILNPLANNFFDYFEQIYAAYGIYSSSYKKLKYQAGFRVEQLISNSELTLTNDKFDRSYLSLYPSVHVVYEKNATEQFMLSYSRRVSRPSHRQLNPFVDYSDSLNIRYGNPKLDPEFINSYEMGWSNFWGKNSLNATLFYRYTTGIVDRIVTLEENGVTSTTYRNLTSGTAYGLELIGNREFTPWFKANANASFFKNIINGSEIAGIEKVNGEMWTMKVNLTFKVTKSGSLMLAGNYKSAEVEAQDREEPVYFSDVAFKYDFLKGKASVSLRVSDVFNSRKFDSETSGVGFVTTNSRRMETRVGYLGFSYRINNYNRNKEKDRNGQNDMEMEEF